MDDSKAAVLQRKRKDGGELKMKARKIYKLVILFCVTASFLFTGCAQATKNTVTMVWYPNESGTEFEGARSAVGKMIEEKTGKKVEHTLTTDYNIAIEAIAGGKADIAFMGALGYVQANKKNDKVKPLVIPSGKSGTKEDAVYYSWLAVQSEKIDSYKKGSDISIDNIKGKTFSFVSNSSTSGFKVPSDTIVKKFKLPSNDELLENKKFFDKVLFGGSHQGSAMNMLKGDAEVAAFCDTCVANYVSLAEGKENTVGAVYSVNSDAVEPFNTVQGQQFTLIDATAVINAPIVINTGNFTESEHEIIKTIFTSTEITQNKLIWKDKDDKNTKALFTKESDKQKFIPVEDSFFDIIRTT